MAYILKSKEFIEIVRRILNSKTDYVLGAFGSPLSSTIMYDEGYSPNPKLTIREYWTKYNEKWNPDNKHSFAVLESTTNEGTFVMDCSGLVQAALCKWTGDSAEPNGGCDCELLPKRYKAREFAAFTEYGSSSYRVMTKEEWSVLTPGEVIWQYDKKNSQINHIAIYLGNGICAECAYNWYSAAKMTSGVQTFTLYPNEWDSNGCPSRRNGGVNRYWKGHGHLSFVDYSDSTDDHFGEEEEEKPVYPEYKRGEKVHFITSNPKYASTGGDVPSYIVKKEYLWVYQDSNGGEKVRITQDGTLKAATGYVWAKDIEYYKEPTPEPEPVIPEEYDATKDLDNIKTIVSKLESDVNSIMNTPINNLDDLVYDMKDRIDTINSLIDYIKGKLKE